MKNSYFNDDNDIQTPSKDESDEEIEEAGVMDDARSIVCPTLKFSNGFSRTLSSFTCQWDKLKLYMISKNMKNNIKTYIEGNYINI